MKRLGVFLFYICLLTGVAAQEPLTREGSFSVRRDKIMALPLNPESLRTMQRAGELGIPYRRLYPDGRLVAVRRISSTGMPQYLTTLNLNAARTISTNRVWKDGGAGLALTGDGLVVGVWDAGLLRSTHYEFGERARPMNPDAEVLGHPSHVSGTIGAQGIDANARGMANKVIIESYDWDNDLEEMDAAAADGLLLSNHSYGYIVGFDYNSEERRWQWWGDTEISSEEDYLFGYYHPEAREFDQVAFDNPNLLIVKSAGNDRGEGPAPGSEHYVWEDGDWVSSKEIRQIDGGEDGFGSMGPISTAKNILVVGAVRDLPDGFASPDSVQITDYSVFGPTDDGRIKPDIVTNGEALFSCYSGSDSAYRYLSGTSMSAPGASGSMALLQEYNYKIHGSYLNAASMKGVVLHTADDAGNRGPDYTHGWGLMNTARAAEVIGDTLGQGIGEYVLVNQERMSISFFCDGTQPVKATLSWTDPAGEVPAPALNPTDRILVNDLDVRVIRKIDNHVFRPFILDPVVPSRPASRGDNVLDNVEQVIVESPEKGFYEIQVSHKGDLRGDSQAFSLILTGLADQFYASGVYQLTDNNGAFFLTSALEYLPGMEAGWLITPENREPVSLSFNFLETEENHDLVRIYDGGDSNAPLLAEFSGRLSNMDTLVRGTGDSLWVSFSSDQQNQGRGFDAVYCTVPPEGNFYVEGEDYPCTETMETYRVIGQKGTRYEWTPPEGWEIGESESNFVSLFVGSGGGLLQLLPYNRCGESGISIASLESVISPPHIEGFLGDTIFCSGEKTKLGVDSLPGATYQWMLPPQWLGSSESHEIDFIPGPKQGIVHVSAYNACGQGDTLAITSFVKSVPRQSEIYSVSDKICQNARNIFYLFADNEVDYQWSVNPDWDIRGDASGDSVDVMIGANPGSIYVKASNECGVRNSSRAFTLTPQPELPLLMETGSIYENLRKLEVQNAGSYTRIQWYLNGQIIDSPLATGPSYVAYIPGLYTVGVSSREGCTLLQESGDGIDTSSPGNLYSVHAGEKGALVIQNATKSTATVNVYDLEGKLVLIQEVGPGRSELQTSLYGVQLVSVKGIGNMQVFRIFLR